ncbi:preprotein translocase subunit SecA [Schlesneria sp.]|uniref:preprotein translocase subunit SecA n=1 Tax=Schlesneria sp. TaxID=2762018 RepID=UPI002EFE05E6
MSAITDFWYLAKSGGRPMAARVARWSGLAQHVVELSEGYSGLTDDALLSLSKELRWRSKSGVPLKVLLPQAYALVREAARRVLDKQHYLVQIIGGIGLFEGGLAEMQTGEGKTLTATLPTYLRALPGRGCHVVTVNDYLAQRDCDLMGPVYEKLGLTVGSVVSSSQPDARRRAYAKDITYATSREIGFDFLRDRLKVGSRLDEAYRPHLFEAESQAEAGPVQRGHYFALIDEADSVLIDDAVTPLIIGLERENTQEIEELLHWSRDLVPQLTLSQDYLFDPGKRTIELTNAGTRKVVLALKPTRLSSFDTEKLYTSVEQALRADYAYERGRDYVITKKKEIAIVDEGTGRTLDGRKWQAGLHQAIEAKERVPITAETGEAARITVQTFFRRYENLAGMTGTGIQATREFQHTYGLGVTVIPTHRRCIRQGLTPRIFLTQEAKRQGLIPEIERLYRLGRAVLIGTPSVEASEVLGRELRSREIDCQILNALFDDVEAEIIAQAGQPGRITIATNMAGRGTDIHLHPAVNASGGLHVIATEMHTNRRIDRQLVGRAARQGDPGSYQFWLSLEDELFRYLTAEQLTRLRNRAAAVSRGGELAPSWIRPFRQLQRRIENQERKYRKQLLKQEKSRETMCRAMGLDPYLELAE